MKEVKNISVWTRESEYGKDKEEQIIRLVSFTNSQRYLLSVTGDHAYFMTLSEAKKSAKNSTYGNSTQWKHKYICPECGKEMIIFQSDFADLTCGEHNYTFFGNKATKH